MLGTNSDKQHLTPAGGNSIVLVGKVEATGHHLRQLVSADVDLYCFQSADEALQTVNSSDSSLTTPTVIFVETTDQEDPKYSIGRLRSESLFSRIPLVVLTGEQDHRMELIEAGADDILSIPLDPEELNRRLAAYSSAGDRLTTLISQWLLDAKLHNGHQLDQALCQLAHHLDAGGAWVVAWPDSTTGLETVSGCLAEAGTWRTLDGCCGNEALTDWLGEYREADQMGIQCQVFNGPLLEGTDQVHLITVPLLQSEVSIGVLIIAFREEQEFSSVHFNLLKLVAGTLVEAIETKLHKEHGEILSLQANLTGMIARIIDPDADLQHLLALTLEHTVLPLGASMGSIWLVTPDKQGLRLASSLLPVPRTPLPESLEMGRGLIGKAIANRKRLLSNHPAQHPDYDAAVDSSWKAAGTILVLPLCRRDHQFGGICLAWDRSNALGDEELVILESIADLTSAFMANIDLIDCLSGYSKQQAALLEMSKQIVFGLDLESTLERGLQWVSRLVGVEFGLLWLVDAESGVLRLEASLGSGLKLVDGKTLSIQDEACKKWIELRRPASVENLDSQSTFRLDYLQEFGIHARDLIALPLVYRGEFIGLVFLLNRLGGNSLEGESAMLAAAADMLSIAMGNALLYSRTVDLIHQRERAHALALQTTRMATIGRLTATLSHEINNPMQAIRGALTLAQEEIDDPQSLQEYLSMSIDESDRVVELIEKMRHVYLPSTEKTNFVCLNDALRSVMVFAQKVSTRQGVDIQMDLASELPPVQFPANQAQVVLLSLILCLSDAIAADGGGSLNIRSVADDVSVQIEFETQAELSAIVELFDRAVARPLTESAINLAFSQDLIRTMEGDLQISVQKKGVVISLVLPAVAQALVETA